METPTPTLDANRDAIRAAYRVIAAIPAPAHAWTVVIAREAVEAAERGELGSHCSRPSMPGAMPSRRRRQRIARWPTRFAPRSRRHRPPDPALTPGPNPELAQCASSGLGPGISGWVG